MTTAPQNGGSDGGDDIRAAEFVLGLLDTSEHDAFAARLASDPALQASVSFWQSYFSHLDEQFEGVPVPGSTFGKIERRLFGAREAVSPLARFWENINLWRGLAAGGVAIAALAIGFSLLQPVPGTNSASSGQLVATLEAENSSVKFLARYDRTDGKVHLAALSGEAVPDRDFELWFIQGSAAPVSLGIVPASGKVDVPLTDEMRATISEGTVFAITLEPIGGGPGGKPTGPVIAAGAVNLV